MNYNWQSQRTNEWVVGTACPAVGCLSPLLQKALARTLP